MSFHITISDVEKGEILLDEDTDCVLATLALAEGSTQRLAFTNCKGSVIFQTVIGAIINAYEETENMPSGIHKLLRKAIRAEIKDLKKNKKGG